VVIVIQL